MRGGAEHDRLARHAVDHRCGFILRDRDAAGLADPEEPARAVALTTSPGISVNGGLEN